jgi:hypothetical protein
MAFKLVWGKTDERSIRYFRYFTFQKKDCLLPTNTTTVFTDQLVNHIGRFVGILFPQPDWRTSFVA